MSPLGAGGMGEVYRARDTRLERDVAMKILPASICADPVAKQRFEREAKTISGLNHPNICTLHDVGNQDGVDYLVMECVEGETLAKRLEKGPLALEQTLKYGRGNCRRAGQGAPEWHRAPRPEARQRHADSNGCETSGLWIRETGLPMATAATLTAMSRNITGDASRNDRRHVSIHVAGASRGKSAGRARSDIFSLGAVLYRDANGQEGVRGKTPLSVASAILTKSPSRSVP